MGDKDLCKLRGYHYWIPETIRCLDEGYRYIEIEGKCLICGATFEAQGDWII